MQMKKKWTENTNRGRRKTDKIITETDIQIYKTFKKKKNNKEGPTRTQPKSGSILWRTGRVITQIMLI